MSATGVAISCVVGAGVFAWSFTVARAAKGEALSEILFAGRIALIIALAFATLGFVAGLLSGATLSDILLADLPGRQVRKVVYLAYGSLTVGVLSALTFAWLRARRGSRGA